MKKIYIGNLSFDTTEEGLQSAFAAFGEVRSCSIVRDRETGRSRGFAFVEMDSDEAAESAISGLNGSQIDGRRVTVNEARPKTGGGGGGGYRRGGGGGGGGYGRDRGSRSYDSDRGRD